MKKRVLYVGALAALLAGLIGCAPGPSPAPAAEPAAIPRPVGAPNVSAAPVTSPQDPWSNVIESARKEGKVTVYSYNLVGDVGLAVSKAFKDQYGITVDVVTGRGAEFLERIKVEKRLGRLVADLHDGSSIHAGLMKQEGFTIPLAAELPIFRQEKIWAADPFSVDAKDKHIVAFSVYYQSPWINTKLVSPAEVPQVWRDLLKPQWKGKMILTDPTTSGGPQQMFVPLLRGGAIDEAFLKDLYKQDLMFSSSLQDEARVLARGERPLTIRGSAATFGRFVAEGAPIKAIDIADGVVQVTSPVAVVFSGGPHPNAARLFANWLLSKEGQEVYTRSASVTPMRSDVADSAPEPARITPKKPVLQTTEDNEKAGQLFRERWPDKLWGRR